MKAPLEPLPPEIQRLLMEEKQIPRQPAGSRQRMLGRAHASLRDPIVVGGVSSVLASLWGTAAAKVATAGAVVSLGILGTTALVVGGSRTQSETNLTIRMPSGAPKSQPSSSDRPAVISAVVPELSARDTTSAAVAAELALLERARASLANGQFDVALQVLSTHRHDFPRGRLLEEREGLRIRALVGQGRRAEARKALNQFRGRFPRSVLLPDMHALLKTRGPSSGAAPRL